MLKQFFCLFLLFSLFGCASKYRGSLLTEKSDLIMSEQEFNDHITKGFLEWKLRHKRDHLENFIKHFEFCARSSKQYTSYLVTRYKMYEMLSRGYYLLANNHAKYDSERKQYWEEGAAWAERALYTNAKFKRSVGEYGEYVPALKYIKKNEIGAAYWYIANIGKWAKSSGIATSLKYLKLLKAVVLRVQYFNPKHFYSAADRYWGAYYSFIPFFAGGNMNKSKFHFEKSINESPEYLGTKVLYAELYALKKQDMKLFRKLLKEVIETKLDPKSEIYPENYLEQELAKKMYENQGNL